MPTYENVIPLSQASFSGKLPRKPSNQAVRSREYLTEAEVGKLMKAARNTGRHGHRDATLILIAYRHALRVAELVALRWEQIDLSQGLLHVVRRKNGVDCSHPLTRARDPCPAAAPARLSGDTLRLRHRA